MQLTEGLEEEGDTAEEEIRRRRSGGWRAPVSACGGAARAGKSGEVARGEEDTLGHLL
jgi:hypothetical protein